MLLREPVRLSESSVGSRVALVVWAFVYFAYPLAASGRTLGMAIVGVRAVRADGSDIDGTHAVVRVLALPLSFLLFGLGFAPDRAAAGPPRPPRPHRLHGRRLRLGRSSRPAAVPPQALTSAAARPPVSSSWYRASRACSSARFGKRRATTVAPTTMAMIPAP